MDMRRVYRSASANFTTSVMNSVTDIDDLLIKHIWLMCIHQRSILRPRKYAISATNPPLNYANTRDACKETKRAKRATNIETSQHR